MSNDKIYDISMRIIKTGSIAESDYNTLFKKVETLAHKNRFYQKHKKTLSFVVEEITADYVIHLTTNKAIPANIDSYIGMMLFSKINAEDKNLSNKDFLYFRKVYNDELSKLEKEKKINSNNIKTIYAEGVTDKNIAENNFITELVYDFELEKLLAVDRWTAEVRDELKNLIMQTLQKANMRVDVDSLLSAITKRLGNSPGVHTSVEEDELIDDEQDRNNAVNVPLDTNLTPSEENDYVDFKIMVGLKFKSNFTSQKSKVEMAVFYHRFFEDEKIMILADKFRMPKSTIHHIAQKVENIVFSIISECVKEAGVVQSPFIVERIKDDVYLIIKSMLE